MKKATPAGPEVKSEAGDVQSAEESYRMKLDELIDYIRERVRNGPPAPALPNNVVRFPVERVRV